MEDGNRNGFAYSHAVHPTCTLTSGAVLLRTLSLKIALKGHVTMLDSKQLSIPRLYRVM